MKGTMSLFTGSFAIQRNESDLADTFLNLSGWHKVNFQPIDALKEDHNFR